MPGGIGVAVDGIANLITGQSMGWMDAAVSFGVGELAFGISWVSKLGKFGLAKFGSMKDIVLEVIQKSVSIASDLVKGLFPK